MFDNLIYTSVIKWHPKWLPCLLHIVDSCILVVRYCKCTGHAKCGLGLINKEILRPLSMNTQTIVCSNQSRAQNSFQNGAQHGRKKVEIDRFASTWHKIGLKMKEKECALLKIQ